jgi:hypothetical protein
MILLLYGHGCTASGSLMPLVMVRAANYLQLLHALLKAYGNWMKLEINILFYYNPQKYITD